MTPDSSGPILRFDLLDVPVLVRCADERARGRLEVCYSACAAGGEDSPSCPLRASLDLVHGASRAAGRTAQREDFVIRVEGREEVRARGMLAAVRAFHHELCHGVMLRATDLFFVHAGVVALHGTAAVLPGLSGAGKSTIVLALLDAGARFLSDELLAYDPVARLCRPFPRALKIRDSCVGWFPEHAESFVGDGEGRYLRFTALHRDVIAEAALPGAVIFPRWQGEPRSTLSPIPRGQAVLELAASALNFGAHRSRSLDHLTDLVRNASTFRLTWSDPHEAASQILRALQESGA